MQPKEAKRKEEGERSVTIEEVRLAASNHEDDVMFGGSGMIEEPNEPVQN